MTPAALGRNTRLMGLCWLISDLYRNEDAETHLRPIVVGDPCVDGNEIPSGVTVLLQTSDCGPFAAEGSAAFANAVLPALEVGLIAWEAGHDHNDATFCIEKASGLTMRRISAKPPTTSARTHFSGKDITL